PSGIWLDGILITRHFCDIIKRALRRGVVAQYAVALAHLLQGANRVGFRAGPMPHFLTLHKKGVPMVVVWVCSEDPVVASSCRSRHRTKVRRYYTRQE